MVYHVGLVTGAWPPSVTIRAGPTMTHTYGYTGAEPSCVVPSGLTSLGATVVGGQADDPTANSPVPAVVPAM